MIAERHLPASETAPPSVTEPIELPLPVVPDWDAQVQRAIRLARLIDRHLDYEAYSRCLLEAEEFTPMALCPEQRVSLLTDVRATVGRVRDLG
jgi:hypothetical protein